MPLVLIIACRIFQWNMYTNPQVYQTPTSFHLSKVTYLFYFFYQSKWPHISPIYISFAIPQPSTSMEWKQEWDIAKEETLPEPPSYSSTLCPVLWNSIYNSLLLHHDFNISFLTICLGVFFPHRFYPLCAMEKILTCGRFQRPLELPTLSFRVSHSGPCQSITFSILHMCAARNFIKCYLCVLCLPACYAAAIMNLIERQKMLE